MNTRFSLNFILLSTFIIVNAGQCFGQDSLKKESTVANPITKPAYQRPHPTYKVPLSTVGHDSTAKISPAEPAAPVTVDRSLNGQYQYLLSKTYRYQQPIISAFYKIVSDTLKIQNQRLADSKTKLATLNDTIAKLKASLANQNTNSNTSGTQQDNASFLGLSRSTYNLITWGLIAALMIALAVVILTTAKYKHEAHYRIKLFDDLSDEFQAYKAKANEKEKKLARELQTERNKLDELLGRE